MDGKRIKAAGAVIERAELALQWLNDCGQQAARATDSAALTFAVETSLGGSVAGYAEANGYLHRACQMLAPEIEAKAEELARAHLAEEREAVFAALGDAA